MMTPDDHDQNCPFCNALWGTCDHYSILAEWEAMAEAKEAPGRQDQRRRRDESSPSIDPRGEMHPHR